MYIYKLTQEGIDRIKAYKALNEEGDEFGNKYVNGMILYLHKDILKLSNPINFRMYGELRQLLKGEFTCLSEDPFDIFYSKFDIFYSN